MKRLNTRGFTIIELLVATISFSLILLILTAAVIQFNRLFYKSSITTRTQEASRAIADDIVYNIQFSKGDITQGAPLTVGGVTYKSLCAGDYRYVYQLNKPVKTSPANRALVKDPFNGATGCPAYNINGTIPPAAKEQLGVNMQINQLTAAVDDENVTITIKIAYFDEPLPPNGCPAIRLGGQFCATGGELTTTINKRL